MYIVLYICIQHMFTHINALVCLYIQYVKPFLNWLYK